MTISRRFFLQSSGALAFCYCAQPWSAFSAATTIEKTARRKTLVIIFLRGGVDGLNLVVPHGDPHYAALRPSLAIAAPGQEGGAIDLDGYFGLHPRLQALLPLHRDGQLAALHAVGYSENTRSHFEEQDVWETGVVGNSIHSDGWLNRHLATSEGRGPIRAVAVGDTLPRILRGDVPAYAVRGIEDLTLPQSRVGGDAVAAALEHAYGRRPGDGKDGPRDLIRRAGDETLEGIKVLRKVVDNPPRGEGEYPRSGLGVQLREIARLIKADVGLEVAEVDFGGWDTHQNQGNGAEGQFGNLAQSLGDGIAAFARDLGDRMRDTLVVTLSDFGRTARENGTRGTDHGWGNCMLAVGGSVEAAGKGKPRDVVGRWPGLATEQLHQQRDLEFTTDFRDVIGEVVRAHLGNNNLGEVIPGHTFSPVGLVTRSARL
ncbi:MAG: DUF1501 domain-containing protein [Planctomycetota bacterium]